MIFVDFYKLNWYLAGFSWLVSVIIFVDGFVIPHQFVEKTVAKYRIVTNDRGDSQSNSFSLISADGKHYNVSPETYDYLKKGDEFSVEQTGIFSKPVTLIYGDGKSLTIDTIGVLHSNLIGRIAVALAFLLPGLSVFLLMKQKIDDDRAVKISVLGTSIAFLLLLFYFGFQ